MKPIAKGTHLAQKVFTANAENFTPLALEVFQFQFEHNLVYQQFCKLLNRLPQQVHELEQIPFLPISFFKTHSVTTGDFVPDIIFESSGTTQTVNSRHLVKDLAVYRRSFETAFESFYGAPSGLCILGLLPSYLERTTSSLVLMVDRLIQKSNHPCSGFYLHDHQSLFDTLQKLEAQQQPTLLIGVTFALLDFAAAYPFAMQHTMVMETGGMKGRRKEMTRAAVHEELRQAFSLKHIHSEYGMTELLSQCYSAGDGLFQSPPWCSVLIREEDDPLALYYQPATTASGAINIIDLANIHSCSFIATEDAGKLHANNQFEILGRLDNTDIRGCSLLAL